MLHRARQPRRTRAVILAMRPRPILPFLTLTAALVLRAHTFRNCCDTAIHAASQLDKLYLDTGPACPCPPHHSRGSSTRVYRLCFRLVHEEY